MAGLRVRLRYQAWPPQALSRSSRPHVPRPRRPRRLLPRSGSSQLLSSHQPAPHLLSQYSSFGLGGPASCLVVATSTAELTQALARGLEEYHGRCVVIGKGSNVLFDDRGFSGMVIVNAVDFVHDDDDDMMHKVLRVGAGTPVNRLAMDVSRDGYRGLEFAVGIPGTVGGFTYMNAGAHGSQASDVLTSVTCVNASGERTVFRRDDSGEWPNGWWDYRHSPVMDLDGDPLVIVEVTMRLRRNGDGDGDGDDAPEKRAQRWLQQRQESQPVNKRSAGCIFRNPAANVPAGKLIDDAGLKGAGVGGCQVSEKHANYLVGVTSACTSADVRASMRLVQEEVRRRFGYDLEPEVRVLDYDGDGFHAFR